MARRRPATRNGKVSLRVSVEQHLRECGHLPPDPPEVRWVATKDTLKNKLERDYWEHLERLRQSDALIINIDYPLGMAAYHILAQVTINVSGGQPPPPDVPKIDQFSVNANQIHLGECVTFNWRTDNADAINLMRNGSPIVTAGGTNGSAQDCPPSAGLYEYRLDAYSGAGQVSQVVMVEVSQMQPR